MSVSSYPGFLSKAEYILNSQSPSIYSFITYITTFAASTGTLPSGLFDGQMKLLIGTNINGNYVLSGTFLNAGATLTFTTTGGSVMLQWSAGSWVTVSSFNVTISNQVYSGAGVPNGLAAGALVTDGSNVISSYPYVATNTASSIMTRNASGNSALNQLKVAQGTSTNPSICSATNTNSGLNFENGGFPAVNIYNQGVKVIETANTGMNFNVSVDCAGSYVALGSGTDFFFNAGYHVAAAVIYSGSTLASHSYHNRVDATAGAATINLPAIIDNTRAYIVSKQDSGVNTVTITPAAGEKIQGADTLVLSNQYEAVQLFADTVVSPKNWLAFKNF
jgi:hypothetical protein